jgi:hypothetical protein
MKQLQIGDRVVLERFCCAPLATQPPVGSTGVVISRQSIQYGSVMATYIHVKWDCGEGDAGWWDEGQNIPVEKTTEFLKLMPHTQPLEDHRDYLEAIAQCASSL